MDDRLVAFRRLLDIMDQLRAGCPWDSKQTIESLRHLTIEETYELSEAILQQNLEEVKKELGDLMLHLVFYAKIGSERGAFDITDVLNGICEKLIVRHPHIFGQDKVADAKEVSENWEKIKLHKEGNRSVLSGVPAGLPPLLKAYRMQQKTAGVGFEWNDGEEAWRKVEEEMRELREVVGNNGDKQDKTQELGDLLFALVNYARYIDVNPDDALETTNEKFRRRFQYVEDEARRNGTSVSDSELSQLLDWWQQAKRQE